MHINVQQNSAADTISLYTSIFNELLTMDDMIINLSQKPKIGIKTQKIL